MVSKVLREELVSVLSDLDRKDESVLEEALSLVRMATTDYKIWKGGLVNTNFTLPHLNLDLQKKLIWGTKVLLAGWSPVFLGGSAVFLGGSAVFLGG